MVLGFPNDFVFVLPMMPLPFFHKKSLSFISVLRGKCHFIFLLSASSVIQSKILNKTHFLYFTKQQRVQIVVVSTIFNC